MERKCPTCRGDASISAKYCKYCGADLVALPQDLPVSAPVTEPPEPRGEVRRKPHSLPPRELRRPTPEGKASPTRTLSLGSKVAALGGLIGLAGCFLPLLASGVGENTSIIPALTRHSAYALLAPLSALAVALMAWAAASGAAESRVMLGGGVIALGSPWVVLWVMAIFAATKVVSELGPFSGGAAVGVGAIALALGFACGVIGGFMILREAVAR